MVLRCSIGVLPPQVDAADCPIEGFNFTGWPEATLKNSQLFTQVVRTDKMLQRNL